MEAAERNQGTRTDKLDQRGMRQAEGGNSPDQLREDIQALAGTLSDNRAEDSAMQAAGSNNEDVHAAADGAGLLPKAADNGQQAEEHNMDAEADRAQERVSPQKTMAGADGRSTRAEAAGGRTGRDPDAG